MNYSYTDASNAGRMTPLITWSDALARVVSVREALLDGDAFFVSDILEHLELDIQDRIHYGGTVPCM